jgi:hypothetical protein
MFAITTTFNGHRDYTYPARYTSVKAAKQAITPRFAAGRSLAITVDGGAFVPLGLDIDVAMLENGAARIYSRVMRCEYVVLPETLRASLSKLCAEFLDLREAGEI